MFFGVTNNDTVEGGIDYVNRFGVPYQNGHAPEVWSQFDDPFRPTTIVFDGDGIEVHRVTGPVALDDLRGVLQEVAGG